MLSYVIVGSGYRAEYFGRVAARYPQLFRAIFLCRSDEKTALMREHTGLPASTDPEECVRFRPDFAVIAVDRGHVADVAEEWILRGFPVVTETPVGDTEEKLKRLWHLAQQGAKIVCCEQYIRQPILSAGLQAVRQGLIGQPQSLYISLLHDYHGASLIRSALQISPGDPYVLRAARAVSPVAETDSRAGAILDGRETMGARDTAYITFSAGQTAVYDFCPVQYRSYIRSRHLTVRGTRGEWTDTLVMHLDQENRPQRSFLLPEIPEKYRALDTQALRDERRNWRAELAPDTVQDEFAIASLLMDMKEYLAGGPSPYPLDEAMEDAWFWLLMQKAIQTPWEALSSDPRPWLT